MDLRYYFLLARAAVDVLPAIYPTHRLDSVVYSPFAAILAPPSFASPVCLSPHLVYSAQAFDDAIDADDTQAAYFEKRCAAHLQLQQQTDALMDAESAAQLAPTDGALLLRLG